MIQLIKAFWKPILVVLALVICSVWIGVNYHKPAPPVKPDVVATKTDSTVTAQMRRKMAKKDSLINALEIRLTVTIEKVTDLSVNNKQLKIGRDTLLNFYRKNHNLHTCDSVVYKLNGDIGKLEEENDSLDSEAQQYSRLLYVERGKSADKDTLIISKERLIVAYQQQFSRINCMDDWTGKHKFWSWLLGIKCR